MFASSRCLAVLLHAACIISTKHLQRSFIPYISPCSPPSRSPSIKVWPHLVLERWRCYRLFQTVQEDVFVQRRSVSLGYELSNDAFRHVPACTKLQQTCEIMVRYQAPLCRTPRPAAHLNIPYIQRRVVSITVVLDIFGLSTQLIFSFVLFFLTISS